MPEDPENTAPKGVTVDARRLRAAKKLVGAEGANGGAPSKKALGRTSLDRSTTKATGGVPPV